MPSLYSLAFVYISSKVYHVVGSVGLAFALFSCNGLLSGAAKHHCALSRISLGIFSSLSGCTLAVVALSFLPSLLYYWLPISACTAFVGSHVLSCLLLASSLLFNMNHSKALCLTHDGHSAFFFEWVTGELLVDARAFKCVWKTSSFLGERPLQLVSRSNRIGHQNERFFLGVFVPYNPLIPASYIELICRICETLGHA